jgi:hypothetical protein
MTGSLGGQVLAVVPGQAARPARKPRRRSTPSRALLVALRALVQTLAYRQSSLRAGSRAGGGGVAARGACRPRRLGRRPGPPRGHRRAGGAEGVGRPHAVPGRRGFGARQRFSPSGGAAYGMPLKTRTVGCAAPTAPAMTPDSTRTFGTMADGSAAAVTRREYDESALVHECLCMLDTPLSRILAQESDGHRAAGSREMPQGYSALTYPESWTFSTATRCPAGGPQGSRLFRAAPGHSARCRPGPGARREARSTT